MEVGQKLTYTISATIPAYAPDVENRYVNVGDKFPEGLTYNKDVKVYAEYALINTAFVNGPFNYGGSTQVVARSYGFILHKVGENNANLQGAEFEVKKKNGSEALAFIKMADGEYRLAEASETGKTPF